jgi:hypothetical protein
MSAQGIYRKRDGWNDQHSVRVKYDGTVELEVPEKFYKEKGWQPLFDELPWAGENAEEKQKIEGSEPARS